MIVKCSHFGTLSLFFGFLLPFRHDFILTLFNLSFPLPNRVIIPKNPILNHKIKKPFEKRISPLSEGLVNWNCSGFSNTNVLNSVQ